jgi:hypothetical protein
MKMLPKPLAAALIALASAASGPTSLALGAQASIDAAPAVAAGTYRFDGAYAGYSTITRGFGTPCTNPNLSPGLIVSEGRFSYPFWTAEGQELHIPVQIRADGSFSGSLEYQTDSFDVARAVRAGIRGRILGQTLQGLETDLRCSHQFVLQKNDEGIRAGSAPYANS